MKTAVIIALSASLFMTETPTSADTLLKLAEDFSRSERKFYNREKVDGQHHYPRRFKVPDHLEPKKSHGIDVSHHNGHVDWLKVGKSGVGYVYAKATQGARSYDGRFSFNWKGAHAARLPKGAYHFMSADVDARAQAEHFISQLNKTGLTTDLAPCLDLEWDYSRVGHAVKRHSNGRPVDQWDNYKPEQIVEKAKVWLETVEKATGKTPIIYTNRAWWRSRIGSAGKPLERYLLWIADYGHASVRKDDPRAPRGWSWHLWQQTDRGSVPGISGPVDMNLLNK